MTGYNQIDIAEDTESWAGEINPIAGEVNISCKGTYHCEITRIDQTQVISSDTHRPVDSAMLSYIPSAGYDETDSAGKNIIASLQNKKSIKVVPLSTSGMPGLTNYYARVKPAKREVHINFYPENNVGYFERLAMIHEFTEPGIYQLRAYREKQILEAGSLLDSASPSPLCIDLLQDGSVKRRFCKKMSSERQGEFVETGRLDEEAEKAEKQGLEKLDI